MSETKRVGCGSLPEYPDECPRCDSEVEERSYGIRCSSVMCLWKRWWQDANSMFSEVLHGER